LSVMATMPLGFLHFTDGKQQRRRINAFAVGTVLATAGYLSNAPANHQHDKRRANGKIVLLLRRELQFVRVNDRWI